MMYVKAWFISPLFLQLSSVSAHLEMDEDSPWDNINARSLGMKLLWCWGGRHHVVREDQRPKPSDSRGWISVVLSLGGLAAAAHWIPRNPGSGNQLLKTGSMFEGKRKTSDHFHRARMSSLKLSNQTGFFLLTTHPSPASPHPPRLLTERHRSAAVGQCSEEERSLNLSRHLTLSFTGLSLTVTGLLDELDLVGCQEEDALFQAAWNSM